MPLGSQGRETVQLGWGGQRGCAAGLGGGLCSWQRDCAAGLGGAERLCSWAGGGRETVQLGWGGQRDCAAGLGGGDCAERLCSWAGGGGKTERETVQLGWGGRETVQLGWGGERDCAAGLGGGREAVQLGWGGRRDCAAGLGGAERLCSWAGGGCVQSEKVLLRFVGFINSRSCRHRTLTPPPGRDFSAVLLLLYSTTERDPENSLCVLKCRLCAQKQPKAPA